MSTDAQRQKRLERAQMRTLFNAPFFAPGVAKLPVIFDETIVFDGHPTACTNGKEIRWHPQAFDETEDRVLSTVLCHEVAHCLLGHIWRMPAGGDTNAWNLACIASYVPIALDDGTSKSASKIRVGDALFTPFGKATVSRVLRKRATKLARIRFANQRTLLCTPDHPIITADGCAREASKCVGSTAFCKVERARKTVPQKALVEAFRIADRHCLGSLIQNLLRASPETWFEAVTGWEKRNWSFSPDQTPEEVATRIFSCLDRWGRYYHGNGGENQGKAVLPTLDLCCEHFCFSGSSLGGNWFLSHKMQAHEQSRIPKSIYFGLEYVCSTCQGHPSVSYNQAPTIDDVPRVSENTILARLGGKPAWIEGVSGKVRHHSSFERQEIIGCEKLNGTEDVYDFVTDIGCYVAGGVLVHNCDENVNQMLSEFGAITKAKNLADPFPMPDGAVIAPPNTDESEEQRYAKRMQSNPPNQGQSKAGNAPGRAGGGKAPSTGGKTAPSPSSGSSSPTGGGNAPIGAFTPAQSGSPDKILQNDWNATLIQAVEMAAKGRGDVPGSLKRFVSDLVNPKVPWFELLRNWLREQCADDWNWRVPDPHFDESGFVLPSLESERMGEVVFATDTSGSIDNALLTRFQTEKQACLDDLGPASLLDIYCDSRLQKVKEYRPGEKIELDAPGGGGTAFHPVLTEIENRGITPKCLVYLTDLDGDFGSKIPPYPVLWIAYGGKKEAPFGEVVPCE